MLPLFIVTSTLAIMLMVPISFLFPFIGGIITSAAGILSKSAKALFGGQARQQRQARRAEKIDIQKGLEKGTTGFVGLFGKRKAEKQAEKEKEEKQEQAEKTGTGIMVLVKKYWWVAAIAAAAIFLLPKLMGKNPGTRRRSSNSGSSFSRRMQAAKRRKARSRK
jgi:hypothetical protein